MDNDEMKSTDVTADFIAGVKRQINIHGELHLDKTFTALLVQWLETSASFEKKRELLTIKIMDDLKASVDSIIKIGVR